MEKVIRCGFVLLLALTIPIWSARGKEIQADNHSAFDVTLSNAARAVLLHAATPECDTVYCCLSIEAGQPRARGDYEIVLSSNQYADRTPTIVTEEGTPLAWIRSTSSGSWSDGKTTRICRHFYRFSPAKKGEYRLRCQDLTFDGVAYDGVLTIQVGALELNAVSTFLLWGRESVVCSLLKFSSGLDTATKPGSIRPTSYGDTAGCRSTPKGSGPITCFRSCFSIFRSSWLSSHSPEWRRFRQMCFSGSRPFASRWLSSFSASNTAGFSSIGKKTMLPPERIDALLRKLAEQYDWTIDHMDRDFFVAHTHPAWWSATWGEQIFVAHDRGGIWINSINDLNKRSSIVSFGYTRRNIRRVTEAIIAQEKDTHSPM